MNQMRSIPSSAGRTVRRLVSELPEGHRPVVADGPVLGDPADRAGIHWHLYVRDDPITAQLHMDQVKEKPEQAAARTPEEALTWLREQVGDAAAKATGTAAERARRWRDGSWLERTLRMHHGRLSWGRSTGAGVQLSDQVMRSMFLVARTVDDCARHERP